MKGKIKEVESFKDFERVYKVFEEPPYNEKYTEEEIQEIFMKYKKAGYIYGAYNEKDCIGIVVIEKGVRKDQPVNFNEDVMYLADIAVLDEYRRTGLGTQLMLYSVMQSKALGYKKMYMRTLEQGKSMSYGIARKIGFNQIPNVYQDVERERVDGNVTSVRNIFLELDINLLDKKSIKNAIENSSSSEEIKNIDSNEGINNFDSIEENKNSNLNNEDLQK